MSILKDTFGNEKRWVAWRYSVVKGRKTKIPYALNGSKASSTDESTWSTYDEVASASKRIGIVFTPDQKLLGIDIDHCLVNGNIDHLEREHIADLILEADTYTEISPSGEGLHLFLKLTEPLKLITNKNAPYELYTSGRYFTVTDTPYGEARAVREVTPDEAQRLLALIGYPWGKSSESVAEQPIKQNSVSQDGALNDTEVLEKMFGAKNGDAVRALYDGDVSAYKKDYSSGDMALLLHLAFWTGKNAVQMERLWLASPLGDREKTQKRADYRERSVATAIKSCKETYKLPEIRKHDLDLLFTLDSEGKKRYTLNTENISRILRKHPEFAGRFRLNDFKARLEYRSLIDDKWRALSDSDALEVQTRISVLFPFFGTVGKSMTFDAMIHVSTQNRVDPAIDFIKGLVWDKTPRLDSWLSSVYGTPDDEYHRAVGANWLKGLVQRVTDPGSKFDYALLLEGRQGIKKTLSLAVLGQVDGDSWHLETVVNTENKDFFMQLQGKAIVEFSEGETYSRTDDRRMKAIITMLYDRYRPPYERFPVDMPRRCVFAMTTNAAELKDETGNRRWLPVLVEKVADVEWLRANRDQLYAEAYARVKAGETTHEFPEAATLEQQELRRVVDPHEEPIFDWYFGTLSPVMREEGITTRQAWETGANRNATFGRDMGRKEEMMIASILRNRLYLERRRVRGDDSDRFYRYYPTDKTLSLAPRDKDGKLIPSFAEM